MSSECETVWRKARPANDFAAVLPVLEECCGCSARLRRPRPSGSARAPTKPCSTNTSPAASVAAIDRLFGEIADFLPGLIEAALARQAAQPPPLQPPGPFPIAAQRRAAVRLMERIGFDFAHGRLDVSAHPFCGGTPDDVRITTRYDESDFTKALMGVLHETGHALYKRSLPAQWRLQPVGAARGMAIHESQSLLLEMQACRSRGLHSSSPRRSCASVFGGDGPGWEAEALHRRQIRVSRSLIRVEADEVTYPAHVILRYRLEQAMIAGDLTPSDLPGAWAEGLRALLGVAPDNDRDGCLQDIHWYDGAWGYFPTYTLGALIAAQLFEAAREHDPGSDAGDRRRAISRRSSPGCASKVHGQASLLSTAELVERATGRPLGTASFERHLRDRYLGGRNEPAVGVLTETTEMTGGPPCRTSAAQPQHLQRGSPGHARSVRQPCGATAKRWRST